MIRSRLLTVEHMKITFPANHQAGMRVPKGGSSCQNCKFLKDEEAGTCGEENFIAWGNDEKPEGSDKIPHPLDSYCSDWYQPREKLDQGRANKMSYREVLDDEREVEK